MLTTGILKNTWQISYKRRIKNYFFAIYRLQFNCKYN